MDGEGEGEEISSDGRRGGKGLKEAPQGGRDLVAPLLVGRLYSLTGRGSKCLYWEDQKGRVESPRGVGPEAERHWAPCLSEEGKMAEQGVEGWLDAVPGLGGAVDYQLLGGVIFSGPCDVSISSI